MIRTLLAVTALAVGLTAAIAQSDIIKERQALMKRSGAQAKIGAQMARGRMPFDMEKVQAMYAAFEDKANKLPNLFPEGSDTGDTSASPAIWEKPDEFKAAIDKFAADIAAAKASTKDLESFRKAFPMVAKNCGGCHESFRIKKS